MADIKVLAEELVNLTVKEVNELATILKEEYGIEPAAAAVAVAAPAAGAGEAAPAEKSTFDVILKSAGQAKLQVIKVVNILLNIPPIKSISNASNVYHKLKRSTYAYLPCEGLTIISCGL